MHVGVRPISQPKPGPRGSPAELSALLSAAQQDDDVDEEQTDEDEGEVDEELLQVPLGLWVHLDLRRSADGRLGHVLDALHGGGGLVRSWRAGSREERERECPVRLLGLFALWEGSWPAKAGNRFARWCLEMSSGQVFQAWRGSVLVAALQFLSCLFSGLERKGKPQTDRRKNRLLKAPFAVRFTLWTRAEDTWAASSGRDDKTAAERRQLSLMMC